MKHHHAMVCWVRINPAERVEQLIITARYFCEGAENRKSRRRKASMTQTKCFAVIFPALQSISRRNPVCGGDFLCVMQPPPTRQLQPQRISLHGRRSFWRKERRATRSRIHGT